MICFLIEKGTLRITSNSAKNDHERLAVMPQNLIAIMRIYAERCFFMKLDSSYLFSHSNGRPLSDSFVSSIHVRILKKAHKSIVATERYVRLTLDSFDYLESALDSTYWHEEV